MPRPAATQLREQREPAPPPTAVIDASFKVVGRRSWFGGVWRGFLALCIAAAVGFLIPPFWVLVRNVGELLR
jgi:hypothetical protein